MLDVAPKLDPSNLPVAPFFAFSSAFALSTAPDISTLIRSHASTTLEAACPRPSAPSSKSAVEFSKASAKPSLRMSPARDAASERGSVESDVRESQIPPSTSVMEAARAPRILPTAMKGAAIAPAIILTMFHSPLNASMTLSMAKRTNADALNAAA